MARLNSLDQSYPYAPPFPLLQQLDRVEPHRPPRTFPVLEMASEPRANPPSSSAQQLGNSDVETALGLELETLSPENSTLRPEAEGHVLVDVTSMSEA